MALSTLFQPQRELVNYDYFDIAEGVGYVVYYGFRSNIGDYTISSTSSMYSDRIASYIEGAAISGVAYVRYFDMDFDLTFNRPKNIKGRIFANIPIGIAAFDANIYTFQFYAVVKAYHWDGATETLMATGQTSPLNPTIGTGVVTAAAQNAAAMMNVTTLRHFKKGETLRFTVEGWYNNTSGSPRQAHIMLCHDPANREWRSGNTPRATSVNNIFANEDQAGGTITYANTQMIFHVPFVLDV